MKIRKFLGKNYNKLWFSFLINIILLLFFYSCFFSEFSTNDDIIMLRIANGFYGNNHQYLIYINVIIGYVFKALYRVVPNVCWYELFQYICSYLSFTFIYYIFAQQNTKKAKICLIITFFASYSAYCQPQYTKLAAYLACAGYCCLYDYCFLNRCTNLFISFVMIMLSFLIRVHSFLFVSLIWFSCFFIKIIHLIKTKKVISLLSMIKFGTVCFVFIIGAYLINDFCYNNNEWASYISYNKIRSRVFDYEVPEYETNKTLYDELNINENAYELMCNWNFDDNYLFGIKTLEKIANYTDRNIKLSNICRFIYSFSIYCFTKKYMFLYVLMFVHVLLSAAKNRDVEENTVILLTFVSTIICILYVYITRESIMSRINYGAMFSLIIITLFNTNYIEDGRENILFETIFIFILLGSIYGEQLKAFNTNKIREREKINTTLSCLIEDKDNLYLLNVADDFYNNHILFTGNSNCSGNILFLGGWQANTPIQQNILNHYGISNPYRDIVNNDKCYLINDNIDLIVDYINDYYYNNAYAICVKTINGYNVYKIIA